MATARLQRISSSLEGTRGVFTFGDFTCASLELPWFGNSSHISCIPEGTYEAVFAYSPHFRRKTYLLKNVHGRDAIRIHSANYAGSSEHGYKCQLLGCIALCEKIIKVAGQDFAFNSRSTILKFEKLAGGKPITLDITGGFGAHFMENPL